MIKVLKGLNQEKKYQRCKPVECGCGCFSKYFSLRNVSK
jgi:hypothetical protein